MHHGRAAGQHQAIEPSQQGLRVQPPPVCPDAEGRYYQWRCTSVAHRIEILAVHDVVRQIVETPVASTHADDGTTDLGEMHHTALRYREAL